MTRRREIQFRVMPDGAWQKAKGRDAWALLALHAAGQRGLTPIDTPGPRWSAYVFKLRRKGVHIETVHESHSGPFPGTHARYVLHSPVAIVEAANGEAA